MRQSGILLPISALPSEYGIGCFSKEAYDFVDILNQCGQSLWQILPLGPTGYGDSPYQSFSSFAGNPYYIDLEKLIKDGLLTKDECDKADFGDGKIIDYEKLYNGRVILLRTAFERAKKSGVMESPEYSDFLNDNGYWLNDYSLFMAVKNENGGKCWTEWDSDIRLRKPEAVVEYRNRLKDDIEFQCYMQYLFYCQWKELKEYANIKGIKIVGDIPIYVAMDSSDAWAAPRQFQLDEENMPIEVAGCPPDGFSADGQLWGNPLYDWDYHKKTDFQWWTQRMEQCMDLYDMIRIDHFRGFDEYYAIPYGEKTAVNGRWKKGPGLDLFKTIKDKLGELPIIAEDLGFLTDSVRQLLKDCGFPGMKVLQFAFDSREESDYLPHNYVRNCVVYTGTHDNNTLLGWYEELNESDRKMSQEYLNNNWTPGNEIHWDFIGLAMRSVADICVIPAQDYLGIGAEGRINTPSTLGGNWVYRIKPDAFDNSLISRIRRLTQICGRLSGK